VQSESELKPGNQRRYIQMENKLNETQPTSSSTSRNDKPISGWLWVLITIGLLGSAITLGSLGGYYSAQRTIESQQVAQAETQVQMQFELGVQDLESGRFEVAKQRFEYIVSIDPNYPGVMDMLAQSMQILMSTATPSPAPLEATATPTRDLRPIEELYNQSLTYVANQEWDAVIDTLSALRKADRTYQSAQVDGMLYLSLRSRGVNKILQGRQLEGGIYDLALAARFGPLDIDAEQARQWARLYIIGLSFWEVHPEQAVYYFSQVAAAVPNLTDASGWTANDRYRAALIQYGDLLANQGEWCEAQLQYELAMSIRPDAGLQETLTQAAEHCLSLTVTPTLETTGTLTTTLTAPVLTDTTTPTLPIQSQWMVLEMYM